MKNKLKLSIARKDALRYLRKRFAFHDTKLLHQAVKRNQDKFNSSVLTFPLPGGGPPDKLCATFAYDPSRKKEVVTRLLDEFNGYLQVDGYEGYDEVCKKNGITRLGCMDHARRKFKEAQHA